MSLYRNVNRQVGTLAQLVEQRTFNPLVTSSNLVRPTTQFSQLASNPLLEKAAGFVFCSRELSGRVAAHGCNRRPPETHAQAVSLFFDTGAFGLGLCSSLVTCWFRLAAAGVVGWLHL